MMIARHAAICPRAAKRFAHHTARGGLGERVISNVVCHLRALSFETGRLANGKLCGASRACNALSATREHLFSSRAEMLVSEADKA
jgi:hypothetical protein